MLGFKMIQKVNMECTEICLYLKGSAVKNYRKKRQLKYNSIQTRRTYNRTKTNEGYKFGKSLLRPSNVYDQYTL